MCVCVYTFIFRSSFVRQATQQDSAAFSNPALHSVGRQQKMSEHFVASHSLFVSPVDMCDSIPTSPLLHPEQLRNEHKSEKHDISEDRTLDTFAHSAEQVKSQFGSDSVVDDPRKQQKDAWTGNPKDTVKGDRYTYKESSAERRQRDRRRVLRQESWLSTYRDELSELHAQQARFEDVVNGFMASLILELS